jgi:hypothetical protein
MIYIYKDYKNDDDFIKDRLLYNYKIVYILNYPNKLTFAENFYKDFHIYYSEKKKILRISHKDNITNKLFDYYGVVYE